MNPEILEWKCKEIISFLLTAVQQMQPTYVNFALPQTGAFLWDDLDQDQWSWIILDKMNWWIHSGQGFIGSFDLPWSKWSRITDPDPDPDHPKGTQWPLWWMCVPSEDINMVECITISVLLNLSCWGQQHSQSHKVKKLKWCRLSKEHVLHWIDKIIYEAVFTREKWMFCSIKASGAWSTTHVLLVFLYKWR